jgi:hypothetical protein
MRRRPYIHGSRCCPAGMLAETSSRFIFPHNLYVDLTPLPSLRPHYLYTHASASIKCLARLFEYHRLWMLGVSGIPTLPTATTNGRHVSQDYHCDPFPPHYHPGRPYRHPERLRDLGAGGFRVPKLFWSLNSPMERSLWTERE